jgi:hypothetical protein
MERVFYKQVRKQLAYATQHVISDSISIDEWKAAEGWEKRENLVK